MAEKHYAFMLNDRAENIFVFAEQNDELAAQICAENNYDGYRWLGEEMPPARWSKWSNATKTWIEPDTDYLISIGAIDPLPAVEEPTE